MRLWLYCLGGLLYDWLVYVAWTVIPIRAEELKATHTQLGLLPAVSTLVYTISCLLMGRLADRAPKSLMARLGCAGAALSCLVVGRVDTLAGLFLAAPLLALSGSIFWPTVQGAIGNETEPARMERAIGLFNVLWSIGKGLGFLTAGWMTGHLGPRYALWSAAAAGLAILLFYPWSEGRSAGGRDPQRSPEHAVFRALGYVANFFAFGLGATFQIHFFHFLNEENLGTMMDRKTFFGVFLGAVFMAQTATFLAMRRGNRWAYRRAPLFSTQLLLAASAAALALARDDRLILALSPLVGIGLGFSYASSIYYSLHGPAEHGKYSGIHEAVLGSGNIVFPLLGGMLADALRDARAPYLLAAAGMIAAVGIEEAVYRSRSRS